MLVHHRLVPSSSSGSSNSSVPNWPFSSYLVPLFQNLSYENEFNLHENELAGGKHFHMVSHKDSF